MAAATDRICLGAIAGVHGVKGGVRIKSFTETPEDIAAYGMLTDETGKREFMLTLTGESRGQLLGRIDGIDDRDTAAALKGLRLYVERSRLPEPAADEFYQSDLIGLAAVDTDGARIGSIRAVHDFGAGDLLEVALDEGGSTMVPFTAKAVPEVDVAAGRVVVVPLDGLSGGASGDSGQTQDEQS